MKNNNLNHFKFFPEECDIFKTRLATRSIFSKIHSHSGERSFGLTLAFGEGRGGVTYTYKSINMQNLKSTEGMIKSTENIFAVDFKSTANSLKTSETGYQPISLSKKQKKINIDQL